MGLLMWQDFYLSQALPESITMLFPYDHNIIIVSLITILPYKRQITMNPNMHISRKFGLSAVNRVRAV